MTKEKITHIFNKHYQSLEAYLKRKLYDERHKTFNNRYNTPIADWIRIAGIITQTANIRYGDFLEEIVNEFLSENNVKIIKGEKEKHYDLFFEHQNKIYVGEIKIRDNHDSSKKRGQIGNLIEKAVSQKKKNPDKNVIALVYFIVPYEKKNHNFYKKKLKQAVEAKQFDGAKVFYGEEFYDELGLTNEWKKLTYLLDQHNFERKSSNDVLQTVNQYFQDDHLNEIKHFANKRNKQNNSIKKKTKSSNSI